MSGLAQGKVIVCGEHAVVYGHPALVSGLDLKVKVGISKKGEQSEFFRNIVQSFNRYFKSTIDEETCFVIDTELPIGSGLGSSAAVAAATYRALAHKCKIHLTTEVLTTLVHTSEEYAHGNPSGIDTFAVVHGGLFSFARTAQEPIIKKLKTNLRINGCLINSGKPEESTKVMVDAVARLLAEKPSLEQTMENIGKLTKVMSQNLEKDVFDFELIKQNHNYLLELDVVGARARSMIRDIEARRGVAKITGAGGKINGSGMILAFHEDPYELKQLCTSFGENARIITFAME